MSQRGRKATRFSQNETERKNASEIERDKKA